MLLELTLVLTVQDSARTIEALLRSWLKETEALATPILVLDAGSRDQTLQVLNKVAAQNPRIKVISLPSRSRPAATLHGYELALKLGSGWILYAEHDSRILPSELQKLWTVRHRSPFILGYRKKRTDGWYRILASWCLRRILKLVFKRGPLDANVPFRLVQLAFLRELNPLLPLEARFPNILLSILAFQVDIALMEVPIQQQRRGPREHSVLTFAFMWECLATLVEILKFRGQIRESRGQFAELFKKYDQY